MNGNKESTTRVQRQKQPNRSLLLQKLMRICAEHLEKHILSALAIRATSSD